MSVLDAFIQGIIQGLTEFFPISSSGHLALYNHFFNAGEGELFFSLLLHVGTLIAVLIVFNKLIFDLCIEFGATVKEIFTGKFSIKNRNDNRNMLYMLVLSCLFLIPLELPIIPSSEGFTSIANILKPVEEGENILIVGIGLLITATLIFVAHAIGKNANKKHDRVSAKDSVIIGITQAIAVIPGISRSGSTTCAALISGLNKTTAINYAFVLSVPAILGATLVEGKKAVEVGTTLTPLPCIVGIVTAAIFGIISIKFIKFLINENKYVFFGVYCALMGTVVVVIAIMEIASGTPIHF